MTRSPSVYGATARGVELHPIGVAGARVTPRRLAAMRRTSVIPARRRAGSPAGRLLVLLTVLAGLFAMHGMSDHGTMSHSPAESHGSPSIVTHAEMPTVEATAGIEDADLSSAATKPGDPHAAMSLCLAILAGAILLALRRTGLSSYPLSAVLTTDPSRALLPARARDPDRPDLHALSIQRC